MRSGPQPEAPQGRPSLHLIKNRRVRLELFARNLPGERRIFGGRGRSASVLRLSGLSRVSFPNVPSEIADTFQREVNHEAPKKVSVRFVVGENQTENNRHDSRQRDHLDFRRERAICELPKAQRGFCESAAAGR